jgi:hypothetical protein
MSNLSSLLMVSTLQLLVLDMGVVARGETRVMDFHGSDQQSLRSPKDDSLHPPHTWLRTEKLEAMVCICTRWCNHNAEPSCKSVYHSVLLVQSTPSLPVWCGAILVESPSGSGITCIKDVSSKSSPVRKVHKLSRCCLGSGD